MNYKTRLKPTPTLVDLTPLVDVIFLLLIFFIITSDVLPLKSLQVDPPALNRQTIALTSQILIVMDADQVLYVGSKKAISDLVSIREAVARELKKHLLAHPQAEPSLVVSVDHHVDYGSFLRLFAELQTFQLPIRLVFSDADSTTAQR